MSVVGMVLTIVVINVVYVTLSTVRFIIMMKSWRTTAALVSMIEIFTYMMGLSIVLKHIHQPINLIAYCVGWGGGVFLGSKIESWLALGYVTFQIVVDTANTHLPQVLRERGYGVTSWAAEGRDGLRLSMMVLAKRSSEKKLLRLIDEVAPNAFVVAHDLKSFRGGFWTKTLR
ncbi:DUF2179 domain-containing protein [Alicyclobacillus sp. ALC3]|uniref:DUF2179 domain-containing protein n=1 Tax=Alicyclobacillus sp. ALC3 TaxID=2796143 RepID=UPI002379B264|nr:DUF2179 domain-containing protein [Alicyclobacillus sp. ALC3]WDL99055.1 DUF2179 domain-containing protein [Alicyclobacillus sp. ALC3]